MRRSAARCRRLHLTVFSPEVPCSALGKCLGLVLAFLCGG